MAVEIKELVIRAVVVDDNDKTEKRTSLNGELKEELIQRIINSSVKEVFRILEQKSKR